MDPQDSPLPCAVTGCCGVVRMHASGSLVCEACGAHVSVWRVPAAPAGGLRRFASPALRRAFISHALLLLVLGGAFLASTEEAPALITSPVVASAVVARTPFDDELRRALDSGRLLQLDGLPAYYADPERFLRDPSVREASSVYLTYWLAQSRTSRIEILNLCTLLRQPELLPFLAEVSWYTISQENDIGIASPLLSALHASSQGHLELAILCMELVANESALTEVVLDAQSAIDGLRYRARVWGR